MSIANIQQFDSDFVLSETINKQYSIIFDGSNFDANNNGIIPVNNRREIELLLLSLGEEVSVVMDEPARKRYPDIWDWLYGRTYAEVFKDLKWSYREEEEVIEIIERIPLPGTLSDSLIKIHRDDPEPERICQDFVHKIHKDCVLISNPYRCGNMFYFNGFNKSSEFNIDHDSDHLEGIIIFEAARQAGIASVHLTGIPLSGAIVILKVITQYTKFVECSEPYLIRTIPVIKQRGGYSFGVFNVVQKGKSCSKGYFTGIVYKSKDTYQKFRNSKLIDMAAIDKVVGT